MKVKLENLKIKYAIFSSIIFIFLYKFAEFSTKIHKDIPSIVMEWEYNIPFLPFFIIPYMSSAPLFILIFFITKNEKNLDLLFKRITFITLVSIIIFFIYPLQFSFEKPHINNSVLNFLFYFLGLVDSKFNQFPSLHVSYSILYTYVFYTEMKSSYKYLICLWTCLITISVLFVYQHHFIDFIGAIFLTIVTFLIFPN